MIDEMQGGGGRERMVAMERERVSGRMAKQGCECAFGYVVVFVWRKWEGELQCMLCARFSVRVCINVACLQMIF